MAEVAGGADSLKEGVLASSSCCGAGVESVRQ